MAARHALGARSCVASRDADAAWLHDRSSRARSLDAAGAPVVAATRLRRRPSRVYRHADRRRRARRALDARARAWGRRRAALTGHTGHLAAHCAGAGARRAAAVVRRGARAARRASWASPPHASRSRPRSPRRRARVPDVKRRLRRRSRAPVRVDGVGAVVRRSSTRSFMTKRSPPPRYAGVDEASL